MKKKTTNNVTVNNTVNMEGKEMNTVTNNNSNVTVNGAQVNNKSMEDILEDTINGLKNKEVNTKKDAEEMAQKADGAVNAIMDKILSAAQFVGDTLGFTAFKNCVIDAYAQASEGYSFLEIADDLYAQAQATLRTMAVIDPNDKLGKQAQFKNILVINQPDGGYIERDGHNSIFHIAGRAICYAIKWIGNKISKFLNSVEFKNELLQSVYEHIRGAFQTVSTLAIRLAKWTGSAVLYVGGLVVTAATKIVYFAISAFEWVVNKFTGHDPDPDDDPEGYEEEEYEEEEGGDAPQEEKTKCEVYEIETTDKNAEFKIVYCEEPYAGK